MTFKHKTLVVYGPLTKLTASLRIAIPPGSWKMALRRITYNGIYNDAGEVLPV